jgi:intracellular sulfur oxidation DsrE/DsrF family protein
MLNLKRFAVGLILSGFAVAAMAADKVVYHVDDTATQATRTLRSLRNHLDVAPKTQITVVALGDGVEFLLDGARDDKNNLEYASLVSDLKTRGVNFEVCELTIEKKNVDKSKFVLEATFTKSGVVRITELQNQKRYAYIKP